MLIVTAADKDQEKYNRGGRERLSEDAEMNVLEIKNYGALYKNVKNRIPFIYLTFTYSMEYGKRGDIPQLDSWLD